MSPPPKGPLVEYRAGITPITRPAPCEATYALHSTDRPEAPPLAVVHLKDGERAGFHREMDHSVTARGPELFLPLQPGAYSWDLVPGSVPPLRKRLKQEVLADAPVILILTGVGVVVWLLLKYGKHVPAIGGEISDESNPVPAPPGGVDYYPNSQVNGP